MDGEPPLLRRILILFSQKEKDQNYFFAANNASNFCSNSW